MTTWKPIHFYPANSGHQQTMMQPSSSPSAPSTSTSISSAEPASPPRPGRLRGLSYLRNYTHNHLHLRPSTPDSDNIPQRSTRPTLNRATTTEATSSSPVHSDPDAPARRSSHRRQVPAPLHNTSRTPSPLPASGWLPASGVSAGSVGPATQLESALSATQVGAMQHSGQGTDVPASPVPTTNLDSKKRSKNTKPTIQFIPYNDISSRSRPSLDFTRISRVLPDSTSIIKVGRYSERDSSIDSLPSEPSAAPVGFKSKVVSRKHCEFWCEGEQWYVKDVGSSSGTFLNHVRLSPPAMESKPITVKDGDIVQLGIDFKGGEEMIFRCVKMRLECNRGWQKTMNKFNKSTHKQLRSLTRPTGSDGKLNEASRSSTECTICLNPIAPCQALFVAPCSHTWHFKCIRKLLEAPPIHEFTCPNCRAQAYLNADVEEPEGYAESIDSLADEAEQTQMLNDAPASTDIAQPPSRAVNNQRDLADDIGELQMSDDDGPALDPADLPLPPPGVSHIMNSAHDNADDTPESADDEAGDAMSDEQETDTVASTLTTSAPMDIPRTGASVSARRASANTSRARTPTSSTTRSLVPDVLNGEGPLTPRNNAGPFVFDGSADDPAAQRASVDGRNEMTNLNSMV